MGARPFGQARIVAPLQPRVEAVLRREAGEDGAHRPLVVTGARQILNAQRIGLQLLLARIAQREQLRALQEPARQRLTDAAVAQQHARENRAQPADHAVALRPGLPPLGMARGDMADLVAEHGRQLCLVVHQRDELARGVDVPAGNREGVVHRAVDHRHGEIVARAGKVRLDGDVLADLAHIMRLRPLHRAAELGQQLRMQFLALLRLGRSDRRARVGDVGDGGATGQRDGGERSGHHCLAGRAADGGGLEKRHRGAPGDMVDGLAPPDARPGCRTINLV